MQGAKDMSLKKQGDDCMVSKYKIRVGDSLYGLYVRYVPYKATLPLLIGKSWRDLNKILKEIQSSQIEYKMKFKFWRTYYKV